MLKLFAVSAEYASTIFASLPQIRETISTLSSYGVTEICKFLKNYRYRHYR